VGGTKEKRLRAKIIRTKNCQNACLVKECRAKIQAKKNKARLGKIMGSLIPEMNLEINLKKTLRNMEYGS